MGPSCTGLDLFALKKKKKKKKILVGNLKLPSVSEGFVPFEGSFSMAGNDGSKR